MPATLLLGGTALIVNRHLRDPDRDPGAVRQYSWADKAITTFATVGYAIPSFLLGLYIAYIGTVVFRGAFPGFGWSPDPAWRAGERRSTWRGTWCSRQFARVQQIAGWSR